MIHRGMPMAGLIVAGVLGAAAWRAEALDLTGQWEGHMECRGLHDGVLERFRCCKDLLISQDGDTLHALETASGLRYSGRVQERARNADRGTAVLAGCSTDKTLPPGSEMVLLRAVVKPPKVDGTLDGPGVWVVHEEDEKEHLVCKWHFRRTKTENPNIGPCP